MFVSWRVLSCCQLASYWELERPIGAIERGVLLLARSRNYNSGQSVLFGATVTVYPSLLETLESLFGCCCRRRGGGRVGPDLGVRRMASEVEDAVGEMGGVFQGPMIWGERCVLRGCRRACVGALSFMRSCLYATVFPHRRHSRSRACVRLCYRYRRRRGLPWDDNAWVVQDGKLITARWSGDVYNFTRFFMAKLEEIHRMY